MILACENCGVVTQHLWTVCLAQRPHWITRSVCRDCHTEITKPIRQVVLHRSRAKKMGLESSLTIEEWRETLRHFEYKCAYCGKQTDLALEHFIPLQLGVGTIKGNCVPSCSSCNAIKHDSHPLDIAHRFEEGTIERVQRYLDQFK